MEKIKQLTSEDIVKTNIEKLKEIFPTIFSEGKIVVEELQALVGEYIQKDKEFYQMTWAGKTLAQQEANKVSTGTLRPCKEESKDWDTTGNIFIEGDNLEALKLLKKSYNNKIKMIYIDPPYNTGKDFVYKDNYKDNLGHYLELTGQKDGEGRSITSNPESDGRYHSNWLNMMYPRLKLAHSLLSDDGVIFISIDDNEQSNLKKLCDEIFGEENYLNTFIWVNNLTGRQLSGSGAAGTREFIITYAKDLSKISEFTAPFLYLKDLMPDAYKSSAKSVLRDSKGEYVIGDELKNNNSAFNEITRPNLVFDIYYKEDEHEIKIEQVSNKHIHDGFVKISPHPNSNGINKYHAYRWSKDKILSEKDDLEFIKYGDTYKIYPKRRNFENSNVKDLITNITTSSGSRDLSLLKIAGFDFPKPVKLIEFLVTIASPKNSIILDFFAGSGSTAHAIMLANSKDNGTRKFISIQLPQIIDNNKQFKTIAEITKERIRRAGELVKQENKDKEGIDKLDVGFRVFKLDTSNIRAWDSSLEEFENQLEMFATNNGEHIKAGRTEHDVIYEILLKYGLDLTVPIQERKVDQHTIYNIGFGSMFICLGDHIHLAVAKAIGEWFKESHDSHPTVIFKDAGFDTDADKTNTVQTLRQFGIENVKSI